MDQYCRCQSCCCWCADLLPDGIPGGSAGGGSLRLSDPECSRTFGKRSQSAGARNPFHPPSHCPLWQEHGRRGLVDGWRRRKRDSRNRWVEPIFIMVSSSGCASLPPIDRHPKPEHSATTAPSGGDTMHSHAFRHISMAFALTPHSSRSSEQSRSCNVSLVCGYAENKQRFQSGRRPEEGVDIHHDLRG